MSPCNSLKTVAALFFSATALLAADWDFQLQKGRNAAKAGRMAEAEASYREALATAEGMGEPGRIANSLTHLGILHREREQYEQAAPLFERALKLYRSSGDGPNISRSLNNIASMKQVMGRLPEAEALVREALGLLEDAGEDDEGWLVTATNLATMVSSRGDYAGAAKVLEATRAKADAKGPLARNSAGMMNQLGVLYRKLARYDEAEPLLKRALEIRMSTNGPDHPETATVQNNLGDLYAAQGRFTEAEALLKDAALSCKKRLGASPRCATMLNNLGSVELNSGRWGEAETHFRDAIEMTANNPSNVVGHAAALNNLAKLYVAENKSKEAKALYERARAAWESAHASNHPDYASTLTNIAHVLISEKNYEEAAALMKRSLEIDEKFLGASHWKIALDLNNLAALETKRKRLPAAEALLRRALAIEEGTELNTPEHARELANLGEVLARQKKFEEAAGRFEQAFAIWEKRPGSMGAEHLGVMDRYEEVLRALREYAKAEAVAARSMRIRVKSAIQKSFR